MSETLKSIYDSICAIKDQLEPLVPEEDDDEMSHDMQEEGQPAAEKTEYTTGEAEKMSKGKEEKTGEKPRDMKKVSMMIAFLKKKKKA